LRPFGDDGIVVLRGVQDAPALRLESFFAGQAERLGLVELPGAYGDEIEVFAAGAAVRPAQIEPPARLESGRRFICTTAVLKRIAPRRLLSLAYSVR
jgi:hypothetical protein